MASEQEIRYHRTFLSLHICRTIYNEDERYQNHPGGPPNRQRKIESDPVFKYHVHSGPRYPQRAPGIPTDRQYSGFLTRDGGAFEDLVIIPKRGQRFASVATEWELKNSVLCSNGDFRPALNSWMEVTGHYTKVDGAQLIHPQGIRLKDISDYIANEIPIYLWTYQVFDPTDNRFKNASNLSLPPGWETFTHMGYGGRIGVLVLPNGHVVGAKGFPFSNNSGHAISVMSPLDFFTPGARLAAGAMRALTNRVGGAVRAGFQLLKAPTKELAELSAARLAGKTLQGMAVSTGGVLPVEHLGRRTLIMGEDLPKFRNLMARSHTETGFYDVVIHGDSTSFQILLKSNGKEVWKEVSVREVANVVRPKLAPGDKIRLLACDVGNTGGPAQLLANELNRTVWASSTTLSAVPKGVARKSFVPKDGGKFYEFVPLRGAATLAGNGGKETGNVLFAEIPHAK